MASTDPSVGEPVPTDKEYTEIIQSNVEGIDRKYLDDPGTPTKIVYFCQECKKQVKPKRIANKFKFNCTECKDIQVSFGSEKSIESYYKNAHKK